MTNPYAAPGAAAAQQLTPQERDRTLHRQHEVRVGVLGWVYATLGVLALLTTTWTAAAVLPEGVSDLSGEDLQAFALVLGQLVGATLTVIAGAGMAKRAGWARWLGVLPHLLMLLSCVGLPVGVWGLWLHLSPKGKRVFAPDYAALIQATPHIPWRATGWGLWGSVAYVFLLAAACGGSLYGLVWLSPMV